MRKSSMTDKEMRDWPLVKPSRIIKTKTHNIKQNDPLCISAIGKTQKIDSFGVCFDTYTAATKFFRKLQSVKYPLKYLYKVSREQKGYIPE